MYPQPSGPINQQRTGGATAGQHSFAQVPSAEIARSVFNRSCGLKTTFDAGWLVPIFVDEALPGDTMSLSMGHLARLATPIRATMDNLYIDFFFFAVPNRLLWENWQKFNGEQTDPGDSTDFEVPYVDAPGGGYGEESLSDYLGIPTKVDIRTSALWHRAYNLIWNEWFRDENLQDSVIVDTDNGPDDQADYVLKRRGKRHDYFTSCLPFPQKGPAVELPLGTTAPVTITGTGDPTFDVGTATGATIGSDAAHTGVWTGNPGVDTAATWNDPQLSGVTDLSTATAATINELREAFQIQRLFERDARGGTRYTEILRSHFGVISPDQRLQRPEYLGGGSAPIMINPVTVTALTTAGDNGKPGDIGGFGLSTGQGHGFNKSFVEHCVIIGLASVRADLNYQQGLERMFSRSTRFDFYWPALAHLGEQPVLNQEIFMQGGGGTPVDIQTFGYQERYAEYRYKPSKVTGQMRSNATTSLDIWHLSQDFAALPVLDDTFIQENPPVDRIVLTPDDPHILFDAYFQYRCARPMPTFSVPGLIDHF